MNNERKIQSVGRHRRTGRVVVYGLVVVLVVVVGFAVKSAFAPGSSKPTALPGSTSSHVQTKAAKAAEIAQTIAVSVRYDPSVPHETCDGTAGVQDPVCQLWEKLSPQQEAVWAGQNVALLAPESVVFSPSGTVATMTGCLLGDISHHSGMWWTPTKWVLHRTSTSVSWPTNVVPAKGVDRSLSCKGL